MPRPCNMASSINALSTGNSPVLQSTFTSKFSSEDGHCVGVARCVVRGIERKLASRIASAVVAGCLIEWIARLARREGFLLFVASVMRKVVLLMMLRTGRSLLSRRKMHSVVDPVCFESTKCILHGLPLLRQPSYDTVLSHASLCIAIRRSSSMVSQCF